MDEVELKKCTARAAKDGALDELGEKTLKPLGKQVVQNSACKEMVEKLSNAMQRMRNSTHPWLYEFDILVPKVKHFSSRTAGAAYRPRTSLMN